MIEIPGLVAALAWAATALTPPEGPHEEAGDPYLAPERIELAMPATPVAGEVASVQVNTMRGMNIVNDAANEPSIAVDPTAPLRMAIGWRQFDSVLSSFRQAGYSWSADGGRSWAGKQVYDPGVFRTDPVLEADADGDFYYLNLRVNPYETDLLVSHDGGQTWPDEAYAYGGDKAWMAVDSTGGIGDGHLYQAWNTFGNQFAPAQFNRSVEQPPAWDEPVEYVPGEPVKPVFGTIDVGPGGEVYVAGIPAGSGTSLIWVVRSDDAWDPDAPFPTFDVGTPIAPPGYSYVVHEWPPNPGGLLGQVNVCVDRSGGPFHGSVYIAATMLEIDTYETNIIVRRSDDGGKTWTDPIAASDELDTAVWRWMGVMDVAPNGRIDMVFNDHREHPDDPNLTRTYYTSSTDGGQTWSADEAIGPEWDSHLGWPNQNKIGDYYDMVSDLTGAHLVYSATYNGEQDVYYARIGPRDCNANGVDDLIDIDTGASADCNANDVPDECEIAAGTLQDADGDGVPDACDCPADLNGDGRLDALDFVAFQQAWQAGERVADCDGNGSLDVIDFVCFQQLFQAGCR